MDIKAMYTQPRATGLWEIILVGIVALDVLLVAKHVKEM